MREIYGQRDGEEKTKLSRNLSPLAGMLDAEIFASIADKPQKQTTLKQSAL